MRLICLLAASAAIATLGTPASAAGPVFYSMKGACESLHVGKRDASDVCKGILIQSINNGFVDFDFVTSDDAVVIFSGRGKQVTPDENTALQPVTEVFFGTKEGKSRVPAVGSCRYTNPYIGVATVDCTAEIDKGIVFHGAFRTNGGEPTKMGGN